MRSRRRIILLRTVAILVAVGAGYVGLRWLAGLIGPPDKTTDSRAYESTLKRWSGSGLVSHFPGSVPPQAQKVRFAAYPGFLQAGAYIQLRIQLPPDQVKAIKEQLKNSTTHAYVGGGMSDHYNRDQKNNWPTTMFRTSDNPETIFDFPSDYTLYVLSAKDRGGAWNHGETSGTAVSTTRSEVVYWADSW